MCSTCKGNSPPACDHLPTGQNFKDKCQTKEGEKCVFPFVYKEKKYDGCTTDYSKNGLAWCATAVNENGNVDRHWGDCRQECPRHDYQGIMIPYYVFLDCKY